MSRHRTALSWAWPPLLLGVGLPALLAVGWAAAVPSSHAIQVEAPRAPVIARGMLLVASPDLGDPNFRESVILICDHGPSGTLGLIINRPTNLLLSEALPAVPVLKGTAHLLFAGGPVQPEAILMLFRAAQAPADTRTVVEGIHIGGSVKAVEDILGQPDAQHRFRAFAGYAGWGPGQLEWETAQGSWRLAPADPGSVFEKNPGDIWSSLVDTGQVPASGRRQETRAWDGRVIRNGSAAASGAHEGVEGEAS